MDNIVSVKLDSRYASTLGVWQYDYGRVLRITGPELPPAVEVQFSLDEKSGETLSRVGTTVDGVTEVKIPDELLKHSATSNYRIYAYIYLTDETSGNTKYEITIPVRVRSRPTSPAEDPETDPDLFRETVVAVNASAERAKMAEQNAKASATEAGKYAASASESAVTAEKTKEDALRKVGEKKREAIEAIQNQEETSVGKITTHTDGEIQRIQNQATDSKAGLEQTITNADASKKELEHSIETAGTSKTALDKSVKLAGTAKTELDTSIREAGTAKTALDESTETAGTVQETLSATVNQAGALDTSLGEKIETGTQLKTDLVASGEKAVQDIRAAGSEQLGKMQAVAEAFTADREQIAKNKEDIGSLKEEITTNDIRLYLYNTQQTRKICNSTLDGRRTIIHVFCEWAANEGYIGSNPCRNIRPIKYERPKRKPLTGIELEMVRNACKTLKDKAIIEMFYSTGCRVTELERLNIEDVDFIRKEVSLFGKGDKHRTSYLNAKAELALRNYLASRDDNNPALFVSDRRPHGRMKKEAIEKRVRKLGEASGIGRRMYPHLIRHTTATDGLERGMPVEEVQQILGHVNIGTTMIYAEVCKENVKNSHRKCIV